MHSHLDGENYGGIADRTDYDLTQHMNHSKQDLSYQDPETNEKYVPYVIEPSLGADRVLLAFYAIVMTKKK